jgi:hypothetical protein
MAATKQAYRSYWWFARNELSAGWAWNGLPPTNHMDYRMIIDNEVSPLGRKLHEHELGSI